MDVPVSPQEPELVEHRWFKNEEPFELYVRRDLFLPNRVTALYVQGAKEVIARFPTPVRVADIGTGQGPICTYLGRREDVTFVDAVEPVEAQCEIARRNIAYHHLGDKVRVHHGMFCEPLNGDAYEIIVADVSGIGHQVAVNMGWYPPGIPTGGPDGTEVILPLLASAGGYLADGGYMVITVGIGVSDHEKILAAADEHFGGRELVAEQTFPLSAEAMSMLQKLDDPFLQHITRRGTRGTYRGEVYAVSNPRNRD